ncbi:hypothetical protein PSI15_14325 [Xenorhabdus sp. PR6a]|uniref:hypothetical protein n=1 Tax=Xenorhabdus sp. PR6a TaxID=3025877 RepID=UPI00235A1EEE|nr:hypothetical protein [Xenorhabdus sp. PR6a]MDC9582727.1 hypothetical protein [Xenorhabdus sp. PR6a]
MAAAFFKLKYPAVCAGYFHQEVFVDNREKLIKIGELIFGNQWQTPVSKILGVDSRAVRRYVAGKSRPPMSHNLVELLQKKQQDVLEAIELVQSDIISGNEVSADMIEFIVSQFDYDSAGSRLSAIDAIRNSIRDDVYLSDLNQIAKKYAQNDPEISNK